MIFHLNRDFFRQFKIKKFKNKLIQLNYYFVDFASLIAMNCKLCFQNFKFEDPKKQPRVLIQCGHTFCDECIELNLNFHKQINCKECGKCNSLKEGSNFPLNETLMGILKKNQEGLCEFIKEFQVCKVHGKKLEAYCESDQQILCLSCILGDHKSHKVISIGEKVQKEKVILKECEEGILKSQQTLKQKQEQCKGLIDKLQLDMNQYIFQINLLCKNISSQLKQLEQKFISETKRSIENSIKTIKTTHEVVKEKKDFYHQLKNIHHALIIKSGVQFLNETNKRLFLIENYTLKHKFILPYHKNHLRKEQVLNQAIKSIQQLITFEKKKSSIVNDKKNNNSNPTACKNQTKITDKNLKSSGKDDSFVKNAQESPYRLQKKNVTSVQKINKQPQILEVNLLQKYQKHQQGKNMKKRSSQLQISAKGKSPKIEYEVRREVQMVERNASKVFSNQGINFNEEFRTRISSYKAQHVGKPFQSSGRVAKNSERSINGSKFHANISEDLGLSFFNETINISSPQKVPNQDQTFEMETPMSINSFMESSQFTITSERKDDTLLKNSRDSFTMFCQQDKILHFGGLKNDSITCQKIIPNPNGPFNFSNQIIVQGLYRSKAHCVVMRSYNPRKCLILGGKDQNGERSNSIFEFDLQSNQLKRSHLQLQEASSGFGAVVNQNKLYIFGGSSFSALKSFHEYKLGKNGFQIKKLSPMTNSRDQLGFALGFDGYLYVGGGINSSNLILNSCERYCFKTNKWNSIPAMKSPRRSFTLVSLPNGLFAIGGHDGKSFIKSVEMYDFELESWIEVAPLNQGRFTHTSVSTNDYQHIIVFGGFQTQPLKTVQIYNTLQNKWNLANDMDRERYLHCSMVVQH